MNDRWVPGKWVDGSMNDWWIRDMNTEHLLSAIAMLWRTAVAISMGIYHPTFTVADTYKMKTKVQEMLDEVQLRRKQ